MKKGILTFLGLLLVISSFGQSWQQTGNTLQFRIVGPDTNFRFSRGTGYMYLYTTPQINTIKRIQNIRIDSVKNGLFPLGLQGQIMSAKADNSNRYNTVDPLIYGNFIYTDDQLSRAFASGKASQLQIFNSFKRFSHGGNPTIPDAAQINDNIPGQPAQVASWAYDTVANVVKSTFNSGSIIGLVSNDDAKFDSYIHTVTLSSTAADNDRIGVVLAFTEDISDLVTNRAFGMTLPGVNTTDPFIPNQHTLIVIRDRNGTGSPSYSIWYDYSKTTQKIIVNGSNLSGLFTTSSNWAGQSVDIKVDRDSDIFVVNTSQYSDAPGGKGGLAFPLTVDLNSDPDLAKFKGKQSYGYAANSQADASFINISFSGSANVIYDLRQGNTYNYTTSGYVIDSSKNLYTDFGRRYYWRNKSEHTFGYILPTGIYDVIVGETP